MILGWIFDIGLDTKRSIGQLVCIEYSYYSYRNDWPKWVCLFESWLFKPGYPQIVHTCFLFYYYYSRNTDKDPKYMYIYIYL